MRIIIDIIIDNITGVLVIVDVLVFGSLALVCDVCYWCCYTIQWTAYTIEADDVQ